MANINATTGKVKGNQGRKSAAKATVFSKMTIETFLTREFGGAPNAATLLYENASKESKVPFSGGLSDGAMKVEPTGKVTLSTLPGRDDSRTWIGQIAYALAHVDEILAALSPEIGGAIVSTVSSANYGKANAFLASLGQDASPDDSGDDDDTENGDETEESDETQE